MHVLDDRARTNRRGLETYCSYPQLRSHQLANHYGYRLLGPTSLPRRRLRWHVLFFSRILRIIGFPDKKNSVRQRPRISLNKTR
jgi:hypothetical protein